MVHNKIHSLFLYSLISKISIGQWAWIILYTNPSRSYCIWPTFDRATVFICEWIIHDSCLSISILWDELDPPSLGWCSNGMNGSVYIVYTANNEITNDTINLWLNDKSMAKTILEDFTNLDQDHGHYVGYTVQPNLF